MVSHVVIWGESRLLLVNRKYSPSFVQILLPLARKIGVQGVWAKVKRIAD